MELSESQYLYLDHNAIETLFKKIQLSHSEIAKALDVSTKTIQRIKNKKVQRVSGTFLLKFAECCGVPPESLVIHEKGLRIKPPNALVEMVTSKKYFMEVLSKESWADYIDILNKISFPEISTYQETMVLLRLASSYLSMGRCKSAIHALDRTEKNARLMANHALLSEVFLWKAMYETNTANLLTALKTLDEANEYQKESPSSEFTNVLLGYKGQILSRLDQFSEAEACLRKSLSNLLRNKKENSFLIARIYTRLGWLYLKQKDYRQARMTFQRALEKSQYSSWTLGIALSKLAIGIIERIQSQSKIPDKTMSRVKMYRSLTEGSARDDRFEKLQFVNSVLSGNYDDARRFIIRRRQMSRYARLPSAYVTLDKMFLARLTGRPMRVSTTEKNRTRAVFNSNGILASLEAFDWLWNTSSISAEEFVRRYIF